MSLTSDGGSFTARSIVLTYNNPVEDGEQFKRILESLDVPYAVFQLEEGAAGTPHYQGYVHFGKPKKIGPHFRSLFQGTVWVKAAKGKPSQNRVYCTKSEGRKAGPWEIGECPQGQGARSDLTSFYEAVRAGKRARDLVEDFHTVLAKYPRYYNTLLSLQTPAMRPDGVKVVLSFGSTGVGKTREVLAANEGNPEFFRQPLTSGFWLDGYDGQEIVLLDDFAGAASKISLTHCLQLLDRYPVQVPVKGSFVWWRPKEVWVTTNVHPRLWYKWEQREEQYNALMRRFTVIKEDLLELDDFKRADFHDWRPPAPVSDSDLWHPT